MGKIFKNFINILTKKEFYPKNFTHQSLLGKIFFNYTKIKKINKSIFFKEYRDFLTLGSVF